MLELDADLPCGARLNGALEVLTDRLHPAGAHWYHGATGDVTRDGKTDAITAWTPRAGTISAVPTAPNEQNSLLSEAGDLTGLQCRPGKHCGQVVTAITDDASRWSMAVIYLPPTGDDARTLLTLNTTAHGGGNYLFLSESGGVLTAKDDGNGVEVSVTPAATDAPRLITLSLSGDRLAMQTDHGPLAMAQGRPGMTGTGDLFIGCRSHRPGLRQTLGAALIMDVMFWPGLSLLTPETGAERDQAMALASHMLWAF